jgi:hypothetical protein
VSEVEQMNKEKYSDPTAEQAIANVMRKEKKKNHCNWEKFMANKTNMERKMEKFIKK